MSKVNHEKIAEILDMNYACPVPLIPIVEALGASFITIINLDIGSDVAEIVQDKIHQNNPDAIVIIGQGNRDEQVRVNPIFKPGTKSNLTKETLLNSHLALYINEKGKIKLYRCQALPSDIEFDLS